jgi:hypothetical protein
MERDASIYSQPAGCGDYSPDCSNNFSFSFPPLGFGNLTNGDRYFFLPKLLTAWLLISGWSAAGFFRGAATAACGLGLVATAVDWHYERLVDHDWPEYARRIEAGEPVSHIPLNPKGRFFDHPGRHRKKSLQNSANPE